MDQYYRVASHFFHTSLFYIRYPWNRQWSQFIDIYVVEFETHNRHIHRCQYYVLFSTRTLIPFLEREKLSFRSTEVSAPAETKQAQIHCARVKKHTCIVQNEARTLCQHDNKYNSVYKYGDDAFRTRVHQNVTLQSRGYDRYAMAPFFYSDLLLSLWPKYRLGKAQRTEFHY